MCNGVKELRCFSRSCSLSEVSPASYGGLECIGTFVDPGLLIDREMSVSGEVLHEESHACCQTDRSQKGAGCPDRDQCLQDGRTIPGRTVSPLSMFVQCEGCTWICFVGSATRIQSPRRYLCPAWCRTRAAYLRQYPVDSQKSSSMADFLLFFALRLSLIHISEPTRLGIISYAV